MAQRILDAGGVVIQPLFPWLWAGGEVAAHMSLKGISTGELLTGQQSGLQVRQLVLHGARLSVLQAALIGVVCCMPNSGITVMMRWCPPQQRALLTHCLGAGVAVQVPCEFAALHHS